MKKLILRSQGKRFLPGGTIKNPPEIKKDQTLFMALKVSTLLKSVKNKERTKNIKMFGNYLIINFCFDIAMS